jgi:hypothetical protein
VEWALVGGAIVVLVLVAVLQLARLSSLIRHDIKSMGADPSQLSAAEAAEAVQRFRTSGAQIVLGLAGLSAILFTWIQLEDARDQAQKEQTLATQGQFADRYMRAVDQLGSESLPIRVGGLYALERVATDSSTVDGEDWEGWKAETQGQVAETLTAYIREHGNQAGAHEQRDKARLEEFLLQARAPDVQVALVVLDHIFEEPLSEPVNLDFGGTDLRRARFGEGNYLRWADLGGVNLTYTTLEGCDLSQADLSGAHLMGADLSKAILSHETDLYEVMVTAGEDLTIKNTLWPDDFDSANGREKQEQPVPKRWGDYETEHLGGFEISPPANEHPSVGCPDAEPR